jgi:2-amino-4-hydroxy-6-hydroxymethyldihydropteridine diphosphokinase
LFNLGDTKTQAHLLLGGNLGDVRLTFDKAESLLLKYFRIVQKSSLYESEPWGMESEHFFINQVWKIETALKPDLLLDVLLKVEEDLGRKRDRDSKGYSDRTIDIDILFMGDKVLNSKKLVIPHPRLHLRAFTLQALVEMDPNFRHPTFNKSISYLLENCSDNVKARRLIGS